MQMSNMDKDLNYTNYWLQDGDVGFLREIEKCDGCGIDFDELTIKTYSPVVVCDSCMMAEEITPMMGVS